jgi:hypothetical protein
MINKCNVSTSKYAQPVCAATVMLLVPESLAAALTCCYRHAPLCHCVARRVSRVQEYFAGVGDDAAPAKGKVSSHTHTCAMHCVARFRCSLRENKRLLCAFQPLYATRSCALTKDVPPHMCRLLCMFTVRSSFCALHNVQSIVRCLCLRRDAHDMSSSHWCPLMCDVCSDMQAAAAEPAAKEPATKKRKG